MAQKLTDLHPRELSLVRRGAVRRPFLFTKADDDELELDAGTVAELIKAYTIDIEEVVKAAAAMPDDGSDDDTDDDEVCKSVLEVYKRDIPDSELKAADESDFADPDNKSFPILQPGDVAAAAQALGRARPNTQEHRDKVKARIKSIANRKGPAFASQLPNDWNVKKEEAKMPEGTGTVVPIKKEDGTWDLSGVSEDARGAVEAVLKAHDEEVAELRKQAEADKTTADEALAIAKAEREQREAAVFVAKAAELNKLPADTAAIAKDMHEISKAETAGHLPEGTAARLEDLLKASNTAIETGDMYRELGSGRSISKSGSAEFDAKVEEIRKADDSLTEHQAFVKAMRAHPDLYARSTEETN